MTFTGGADARIDETGDGFDTDNDYDEKDIDEAIPDPEIIERDPIFWLDAIDYAYSE